MCWLRARIRAVNAFARIHETRYCEIDLTEVIGRKAFDLNNILAIEPEFLADDAHQHDEAETSVAIVESGALDSVLFNRWLQQLVQTDGRNLYRMKGILNIDDEDRRFVVQGVHMTLEGRPGRAWAKTEVRRNEMVFIGRGLDAAGLNRGFRGCIVS